MMTFTQRAARHLLTIKATREIKREIEKAGLENLQTLALAGVSIVRTYLKGCSPEEQKRIRRDFNSLLQMGVTPDMIFDELSRQIPDLAPIIEERKDYKKSEVQNVLTFLKEG